MELRHRRLVLVLNPDDANIFSHRVNWNQLGARGGGGPCYASRQIDLNVLNLVVLFVLFAVSIWRDLKLFLRLCTYAHVEHREVFVMHGPAPLFKEFSSLYLEEQLVEGVTAEEFVDALLLHRCAAWWLWE